MKKTLIGLSVLALFAIVGVAQTYADLSGSADADVYVVVNPNVTVGANTPIVNAGTVQTGEFSATINFRIDANKEQVSLFVEASPLYKGDDPTNADVPPIPLNLSKGVDITPANANPLAAGSNNAQYIGSGDVILDFPTQRTQTIAFESSQNGHFSQDVLVQVWWLQDDPEKPMGEYSGKVRITALLLPS